MKTALQKQLAKVAPSLCILTLWEHDQDASSEWRELSKPGNCFEGEDPEDWQAWQSEVRATCIYDGEEITGSAYLGGTWEKAGDDPAESNPEISGYEPQMTAEALEELAKNLPIVSAAHLQSEIESALSFLATLN